MTMENYNIDKMNKEELKQFIKSDDYYRDFVLYKNYLKFGEYFLKNKVVREKRRFVEAIKSLFKHFPKAGQIVFTKLYGLDENNPIPQTIEEFSKDYNIEIKDVQEIIRWTFRKVYSGRLDIPSDRVLEQIYEVHCKPNEKED